MYEQSNLFGAGLSFIKERSIGVIPAEAIKAVESVSHARLKELYRDKTYSPIADMAEGMSPSEVVEWMGALVGAAF
jgi:hypothetical protein